jgi:bifunctional DNA-binding transcriptional regulator/antitoxin component of YhaV-PrlF toxin-antitoxin module
MILSKVLSKFQVTLPKEAVKALHIEKGHVLKCTVEKGGVLFRPVIVEEAYAEEELKKFDRLYNDPKNKGKSFKTRAGAMAYLKSLHAHR